MGDSEIRTASNAAFAGLVVTIALMWTFHATDWSTRTHLTIVGAVLELVGVALVAMDFWRPWLSTIGDRLEHLAVRFRRQVQTTLRRVARLLRRRQDATVRPPAAVATAGGISPTGVLTLEKNPSNAALARQLGEFVARLSDLENRQADDVRELRERLDAMVGVMQEMIRRSKDQFLGWRIVGLVIAFTGAVVLASANLV